jgi:hypothetical protein
VIGPFGLGDQQPSVGVDPKRDRILNLRLGRDHFRAESIGDFRR